MVAAKAHRLRASVFNGRQDEYLPNGLFSSKRVARRRWAFRKVDRASIDTISVFGRGLNRGRFVEGS